MNPKSLAFVAPYFPPHGGGLERYAREVAVQLKAQGMPVIVITSGARGGHDSVEMVDGLKVYRLGYRYKISNTPFAFDWFSKIKNILQQEHVDLLNVHMPVPGIGDVAAWVAGRRPVIITYHSGSMKKGSFFADLMVSLYENILLPLLLNRAQHIIATSRFVAQFIGRAQKTSVITPGVDTGVFRPGIKDAEPTVLFVANLTRSQQFKGLDTLLQAMEHIPSAQLLVVGDGELRANYETRARDLGVRAKFLGMLEGASLADAFARAWVLVLPTTNDNFPMTILEAAAAGTPAIASRIGSIPDIIEDGVTGYVVEPNADVIANKIIDLIKNGDGVRMGDAARAKAVTDFRWEERMEQYKKIILRSARTIVHISAYYPPHLGGVERVVETAAHMQARAGSRVMVLTSNSHALTTHETDENMTVERLASVELAHTPFAPTLWLKLLRLPKNSLIHLHLAQAYWADLVWLIAPLRRMPYIVHFHLDVEPSGIFGWLFILYKKIMWGPILRGARRILVCSPAQIPLVEGYGVSKKNIAVVPNGVGQEFFSSRSFVAPEGGLRLLSVGRLAAQKSVDRLVEMMEHLKIPAHLVVVGDGDESESLERLIKQKKLANITLVGGKPAHEVRAYHAQADVFVISSQKEGLPLSVLEAMAAGLPVVATDVIGLRELLSGTGVLVAEPYAQNMARALEDLWQTKSLLQVLSMRSRQKATEFAWPRFYEALTAAYEQTLQ